MIIIILIWLLSNVHLARYYFRCRHHRFMIGTMYKYTLHLCLRPQMCKYIYYIHLTYFNSMALVSFCPLICVLKITFLHLLLSMVSPYCVFYVFGDLTIIVIFYHQFINHHRRYFRLPQFIFYLSKYYATLATHRSRFCEFLLFLLNSN